MHTPEQAKALWCPMVRIARREHSHPADDEGNTAIASGCNTDALGGVRVPASCRCIADQCAMWRWGTMQDPNWVRPQQPPESFMPAPIVRSNKGYCGLSGIPAP